jgi:DNA-binding HxlR family transcriptional regulator
VLHIVHALLAGPKGFNAIGREVGGCNPTTLTQRLTRLEALGLIVKAEGDGTCRACYRLTEAGAELDGVIGAIQRWADVHLSRALALGPSESTAGTPDAGPAPPTVVECRPSGALSRGDRTGRAASCAAPRAVPAATPSASCTWPASP